MERRPSNRCRTRRQRPWIRRAEAFWRVAADRFVPSAPIFSPYLAYRVPHFILFSPIQIRPFGWSRRRRVRMGRSIRSSSMLRRHDGSSLPGLLTAAATPRTQHIAAAPRTQHIAAAATDLQAAMATQATSGRQPSRASPAAAGRPPMQATQVGIGSLRRATQTAAIDSFGRASQTLGLKRRAAAAVAPSDVECNHGLSSPTSPPWMGSSSDPKACQVQTEANASRLKVLEVQQKLSTEKLEASKLNHRAAVENKEAIVVGDIQHCALKRHQWVFC